MDKLPFNTISFKSKTSEGRVCKTSVIMAKDGHKICIIQKYFTDNLEYNERVIRDFGKYKLVSRSINLLDTTLDHIFYIAKNYEHIIKRNNEKSNH